MGGVAELQAMISYTTDLDDGVRQSMFPLITQFNENKPTQKQLKIETRYNCSIITKLGEKLRKCCARR